MDYKNNWHTQNNAGNKDGAWDEYINAQVVRAKNGYIDDIGDGSGYREFSLSAADRDLPEAARDEVIRYRVMAMLDPANTAYYNAMANDIRIANGGYTSTDGMDYNRVNDYNADNILDMVYRDDADFVNPYEEQINGLIERLYNQEAWNPSSYDPSTDPAYQAYEQYYTRNANAAAQQALANASANSGGLANSYAQQLAAASAQSYMKQLSDIIPTLQQNARDAYESDIANRMSLLGSLNSMLNDAYGRFDTDRKFAEDQWLQNWQNAFNKYQVEQNISNREDEQAWQEAQNQLDRDLQKYLASLK